MLAISFATTPELSVLSSFRFLKIAQEILISSSLHSKSLKKFIQEVTDFSNVQIISRISDNCRITFAIIVHAQPRADIWATRAVLLSRYLLSPIDFPKQRRNNRVLREITGCLADRRARFSAISNLRPPRALLCTPYFRFNKSVDRR